VGVAIIVREVGHDLRDLWNSLWVGHDGVKSPVVEVKILKVVYEGSAYRCAKQSGAPRPTEARKSLDPDCVWHRFWRQLHKLRP
jgi:hypothetical protein